MDHLEYFHQIHCETPFVQRLRVAKDCTSQSPVHPLVTFSEYIFDKAISKRFSQPLALIFPYKNDVAKWITLLSVLRTMESDYYSGRILDYDFEKGQNLLLNNRAVVQFDRFEDSHLYVKAPGTGPHGPITFSIPISKIFQLQPTTKKRLSSLKKVKEAWSGSASTPIDNILEIRSFGNYQIFETNIVLVDRLGATESTIKEIYVNGKKLDELFAWGKLDRDGDLFLLKSYSHDCKPSAIIAPDLYSVSRFLEGQTHKTKAIIISDAGFCRNDPHSLTELQDSGLPILLVADLNQVDNLVELAGRSFRMLVWSKDVVHEILNLDKVPEKSVFTAFGDTLKNYSRQIVETIQCHHSQLDSAITQLNRLEKKISTIDDTEARSVFSSLYRKCNQLSELIRVPSQEWLVAFITSIQNLNADFKKRQLWVSPELISGFSDLADKIIEIGSQSLIDPGSKINHLQRLLNESKPSERLLVVVSSESEIEPTKEYWLSRIEHSKEKLNMTFVTPGGIPDDFSFDSLIVAGWFGRSKMYSILHSYTASKVTLMMYEHEQRWYKSALKRWAEQENTINQTANDIASILEVPIVFFQHPSDSTQDESCISPDSDDNFMEIENRIRSYKYEAFKPSPSSQNEVEKAKRINFEEDIFAFFSKTHKCIVVNDFILESPTAEIRKLTVNDLKIGDYVLFFDSDKDLIRQYANKILKQENKSGLREIATLWKLALRTTLKELNNFDALVDLLRQHGCKRHFFTIRNWLLDEDMIAPNSFADVKIIAAATKDELLNNNLTIIQSAISEVRGAHLRASSFLARRLMSVLPQIITSDSREHLQLRIDIPDFGSIIVLLVEEIDEQWVDIEKSYVNRLLR